MTLKNISAKDAMVALQTFFQILVRVKSRKVCKFVQHDEAAESFVVSLAGSVFWAKYSVRFRYTRPVCHPSWISISSAPISRINDCSLGKIRITRSLRISSSFKRSRPLVVLSRHRMESGRLRTAITSSNPSFCS